VRKALLEYDDVLRKQRETIYEQRNEILEQDNVHDIVNGMFDRYATALVASHTTVDGRDDIIDYDGIKEALETLNLNVDIQDLKTSNTTKTVFDLLWNEYEKKFLHNEELAEIDINHFEKAVVLKIIDAKWMDHIDLMSKLRENIHLRSYGKDNPLKAYTQEGYEMFEDMMNSISDEVIKFFMVARIEVRHEGVK
ncbi:MAG: preprotein translocase subunit SecA, partial [Erysipelotrichaceae bacterium]|nr:preprotein translocase subunit SecA [Erysipelotrichaceae bacterium]